MAGDVSPVAMFHFLPAVRSALPVGVVRPVVQDEVDNLVILLCVVSKGYLHRSCDVHFQPGRRVGLGNEI